MTESKCVIVLDVDGVVVEPWGFATVLDRDFGLGPDRTRGFFSAAHFWDDERQNVESAANPPQRCLSRQ